MKTAHSARRTRVCVFIGALALLTLCLALSFSTMAEDVARDVPIAADVPLASPEASDEPGAADAVLGYVQVVCDVLNLRAEPRTDGQLLGSYARGSYLAVSASEGEWLRVIARDGKRGYMKAQYLKALEAQSGLSARVVTGGSQLNLREAPDLGAKVIGQLNDGDEVQLLSEAEGWFLVLANGLQGYAAEPYIDYPGHEPAAEAVARPHSVDVSRKLIALTFDDGPGAATFDILKALEQADGRATFFMLGSRVESYAEEARAVAAQGSQIGIHGWAHASLTKVDKARVNNELKMSIDAVRYTTGVTPTLLRPPYGNVNDDVKEACARFGLSVIEWNIDPEDWKKRDAKQIYDELMKTARGGGIVVCHDIYPETAQALQKLIPALARDGYSFVTVSELKQAYGISETPGEVYYGESKS